MNKFKKICYCVIAIFILFISIKALMQTNGETAQYLQDNLVIVEDGQYHKENDGKVVLVKGTFTTDNIVKDEKFGVSTSNAARLERNVYEYRWHKDDNYSPVETRWEDKSTARQHIEGYKYDIAKDINKEKFVTNIKLNDAFEISGDILNSFPCNTSVEINNTNNSVDNLKVVDNEFTSVKGDSPAIGDIAVSFKALDLDTLGTVAIIAKQEDGKLVKYVGNNTDIIFDAYEEDITLEKILEQKKEDEVYGRVGVGVILIITIIVGLFIFRDDIKKFKNRKNTSA